MEKYLTPYNLAFQLKSLDFDDMCFGFYNIKGTFISDYKITKQMVDNLNIKQCCLAPTYEQVFSFFETKYGYYVDKRIIMSVNEVVGINYFIKHISGVMQIRFDNPYDEFDPIITKNKCIQQLLDIVKNNEQ